MKQIYIKFQGGITKKKKNAATAATKPFLIYENDKDNETSCLEKL